MARAEGTDRQPVAGLVASRQRVWDLPLRLAHGSLAVCVVGSFTTHYLGPGAFDWHVRFGYATLIVVLFRLLWGGVGTRHARFVEIVRALKGRAAAVRTRLGALMAIALLALLLAQALTGLFSNDEVMNAGPLAGWLGLPLSNRVSDWHGTVSNLILAAVAVHVAAALYYRLRRRDDRITPLVTGFKVGLPAGTGIASQRIALAAILLLVLAVALYGVLSLAPPPLDLVP